MFERGGLQTRVVRRTVGPGRDWEFNLAEWWSRPGQNVNVGIRLTCDGPCPGTVALWHSPFVSGASMTVYPIPFTCP